jgi:integrase/recombinase XerC
VRKGKGDRQREAPLHPVARQAVLVWLQERRERWGEPENAGRDVPCFVSYQGKRLSVRSIDKLMDQLGVDAAIEGLSAHVLRHTFTTNLIRAGHDLVLVAELTGHARLETVRRYSLPTERDKERAVAALLTDR